MDLPRSQGMRVRPSGHLPFDLERPEGSRQAGMPAEDSDQKITSLRAACLWKHMLPLLQERPWIPRIHTGAPQCLQA